MNVQFDFAVKSDFGTFWELFISIFQDSADFILKSFDQNISTR